jgi:hypothetical protein
MAKAELTKTIEAIKLNKRTLRPIIGDSRTIPFGAIVEHLKEDGDQMQFDYLGEPYETKLDTLINAIRRLD